MRLCNQRIAIYKSYLLLLLLHVRHCQSLTTLRRHVATKELGSVEVRGMSSQRVHDTSEASGCALDRAVMWARDGPVIERSQVRFPSGVA